MNQPEAPCVQCQRAMTHVTRTEQLLFVCLYPDCANYALVQLSPETLKIHTAEDCKECKNFTTNHTIWKK